MYDLKKGNYVVLEFSSAEKIVEKKTRKEVKFNRPCIIEIAAVKIVRGEIAGTFASFFAIEGYDSKLFDLDETDYNNNGVTTAHLIAAPFIKEEIGRINSFLRDSTLLMRGQFIDEEFEYLRALAMAQGFEMNNALVNMGDLCLAVQLQFDILSGEQWEKLSPIELAGRLKLDCETWDELFVLRGIPFYPAGNHFARANRIDSLSWALALAQLFIQLNEDPESPIDSVKSQILDDDCPFGV